MITWVPENPIPGDQRLRLENSTTGGGRLVAAAGTRPSVLVNGISYGHNCYSRALRRWEPKFQTAMQFVREVGSEDTGNLLNRGEKPLTDLRRRGSIQRPESFLYLLAHAEPHFRIDLLGLLKLADIEGDFFFPCELTQKILKELLGF